MTQEILEFLTCFSPEVRVLVLSALPVTELRATIPFALGLGMKPLTAFTYAIIGNFLPVIPLLLGLPLGIRIFEQFFLTRRFVKWVLDRTLAKSERLQRFGAVGLLMFVAVPLPGTGVWTGSLAALLIGVPFRLALVSITSGMVIAGVVVLMASSGLLQAVKLFNNPLYPLALIALLISVGFIYKYKKHG